MSHGELTSLALVPRTLQQPSPPPWQVIDSPRSIEFAADGLSDYLRWVCHWRGLANHVRLGEMLPRTNGKLDPLDYEWLHPRNLLFGTPDYVAEKIEEMREVLNLETLLVRSTFPGVGREREDDPA